MKRFSIKRRTLKLYGLDETIIAEIFKHIEEKTEGMRIGHYPRFPENHITMELRGDDEQILTQQMDRIEAIIKDRLGPFIFSADEKSMEQVVGHTLLKKGLTISVAESCTGGLIGHRLTDVPGSSAYFMGGVVVYNNRSKIDFLQVKPDTLEKHGAVSDAVVRQMAGEIKNLMKTDLGLAVTGIAGPDGGSPEKPVGTVYIGLAAGKEIYAAKYLFPGDRKRVKVNTSMMALDWIRRYINGDSFIPGI